MELGDTKDWTLDQFIEAFKTWPADELPPQGENTFPWLEALEHVKQMQGILTHCVNCKFPCFHYGAVASLMPGHCYTQLGVAEVRISGFCEFCFDAIARPDDASWDGPLGESEEDQIKRIEKIVDEEAEKLKNQSFNDLMYDPFNDPDNGR